MTKSANDLNNDLAKIRLGAFQWKMNFNPDLTKQAAQEVIFSRKLQNFISSRNNFQKLSKKIGILHKFQNLLPRKSLLTVCKSFIRPHLDHGDIIYD